MRRRVRARARGRRLWRARRRRAGRARVGERASRMMAMVVGALAAVNSHGSVKMPGTDVFWAWPYEQCGEFGGARPPADLYARSRRLGRRQEQSRHARRLPAMAGRTNTTLCCVATNVALTPRRGAAGREDGDGGYCARGAAGLCAVRWRCGVLPVDRASGAAGARARSCSRGSASWRQAASRAPSRAASTRRARRGDAGGGGVIAGIKSSRPPRLSFRRDCCGFPVSAEG